MKKPIVIIGENLHNRKLLFSLLREKFTNHKHYLNSMLYRDGFKPKPTTETLAVFAEFIPSDNITPSVFRKMTAVIQEIKMPNGSIRISGNVQYVIATNEMPLISANQVKQGNFYYLPQINSEEETLLLSKIIWLDMQIASIPEMRIDSQEAIKLKEYYENRRRNYRTKLNQQRINSIKNIEVREFNAVVA